METIDTPALLESDRKEFERPLASIRDNAEILALIRRALVLESTHNLSSSCAAQEEAP
jgi:hypothetical protein